MSDAEIVEIYCGNVLIREVLASVPCCYIQSSLFAGVPGTYLRIKRS